MPGLSRRRLMDIGLIGSIGVAASIMPAGRASALSLQPMDQEVGTLYQSACTAGNRHAALADALIAAARARDVALDEDALRHLLEGTACPLCGCSLAAG